MSERENTDNMRKQRYIAIDFPNSVKRRVEKWCKTFLTENDLADLTPDKRGIVTGRLHVTLLYGVNGQQLPPGVDTNVLNKVKLCGILTVERAELFDIGNPDCKALVLLIDDARCYLRKAHDFLKKELPLAKDHNGKLLYDRYSFNPHITVAYVRTNFDMDKVNKIGIPMYLEVGKVEYRLKSAQHL